MHRNCLPPLLASEVDVDEMNRDDRDDWLALAVAHLTSLNKIQTQIQAELNLRHQKQVSNLLQRARAKGWIQERVNFPPNLSEHDIDMIKALGFSRRKELQNRLDTIAKERRGVLVKVHVVHAEITTDRYTQYSKAAAQELETQLTRMPQGGSCAVAWGRTVHRAIEAMPAVDPGQDILFVPVSGEPMNYAETGSSPSLNAQQLADKCHSARLSLRGVPARIPKDLALEAGTIRRFMGKCHHYRDIFHEPSPLMGKLDMIISGIGDAATSEDDPWFKEIKELEGDEGANDLRAVAAGNIGGVWIPKSSTNDSDRKRLREINSRWLGIQEEHLLACAKKASQNPKCPGVVVLAIEPEKAGIVHRAIGMVNRLVITQPLALALLDLIGATPGTTPREPPESA
jgi:DNA-binding transcriptional regulator LsrR (DeoR family)